MSSPTALLSEKTTPPTPTRKSSWITPRILSDFTIGLSDGLTVPFALTAGLSALGNGRIVVAAGLAELVAGAISMGVAGYLGAKGERDAQSTSTRGMKKMIVAEPEEALAIVKGKFQDFALPEEILLSITNYYSNSSSDRLLKTLMRFEECEAEAQMLRPCLSGATIAVAYFFGGSVPLLPYTLFSVETAFIISIIVTVLVLFCFGFIKGPLAGSNQGIRKSLTSGFEMLVLGGLAAAAALTCVKMLNQSREP